MNTRATRRPPLVSPPRQINKAARRVPDVIEIDDSDPEPDHTSLALQQTIGRLNRENRQYRKDIAAKNEELKRCRATLSETRTPNSGETSEVQSLKAEILQLQQELQSKESETRYSATPLDSESELASLREQLQESQLLVRDSNQMFTFQVSALETEISRLNQVIEKQQADNAITKQTLSKIYEAFECSICFNTMWHPYTLPSCGHVFCSNCKQQSSCPLCRKPTVGAPVQAHSLKEIVRLVAPLVDPTDQSPRRR